MDIWATLKTFPEAEHAVLVVTKSTNKHALVYYWTPETGSLTPRWILHHGNDRPSVAPVDAVHRMFLDVDLRQTDDGRVEVIFRVPLAADEGVYLGADAHGRIMALVYPDGPAAGPWRLMELHADLTTPSSTLVTGTCQCLTTGQRQTRTIRADLGMFAF